MKKVTVLTIQAPSRPGVLAEILRALDEDQVRVEAVFAPDAVGAGIIRLQAEPLDLARSVLNQLQYPFSLEDIFILTCQDWKEIHRVITQLGIAKINIEFCFSSDGTTWILGTDKVQETEALLSQI